MAFPRGQTRTATGGAASGGGRFGGGGGRGGGGGAMFGGASMGDYEPIPKERLEALPFALLCVPCSDETV